MDVSMWNTDPEREVKAILDDIKDGAVKSYSQNGRIGLVLAPFAALLVRLSRDADASAARMERLTRRLYVLTIFILVLTLLLLVREIGKDAFDLYEKRHPQYQGDRQAQQNRNIDSD